MLTCLKFKYHHSRVIQSHGQVSFTAVIASNANLYNIQKLYYLKSVVIGQAAELIAPLELTNANFLVAWHLLEERYFNKEIIIDSLVREPFQFIIEII